MSITQDGAQKLIKHKCNNTKISTFKFGTSSKAIVENAGIAIHSLCCGAWPMLELTRNGAYETCRM